MSKAKLSKGILICLSLSILLVGCSPREISHQKEGKGKVSPPTSGIEGWGDAPDFTLPALEDKDFTLSSLKGKVILLNFWATWCPPCRKEIPDFVELYEKYREKGLEIVGVSLDREKEKVVKPFAEKMGINYTLVFGNQEVEKKYGGITGIPTTFLINRKGNIAKKYIGYRAKETWEREIKRLLGE